MEEARGDAGLNDPDVDVILAVNDAVGNGSFDDVAAHLDDGRYRVRGDLLTKHRTSDTELKTSYEQVVLVRDGRLIQGWFKVGEMSLR